MIKDLRYWCNKILPTVFDDSLSYYEVLCKVTEKLNEVIDVVNMIDIEKEINDYIEAHPELVTFVQDNSITERKIYSEFLPYIKNNWATPEMFGAYGDGVHDDTAAIQAAFDSNLPVLLTKEYLVTPATNTISVTVPNKLYVCTGKIVAAPTELTRYNIIFADFGMHSIFYGFNIENYRNTVSGEWGHCFYIRCSCDIIGGKLTGGSGDGIVVHDETPSTNIVNIDSVIIDNVGRNGVTVGEGHIINIRNCRFTNITYKAPKAGIDIEPNSTIEIVDEVNIDNCYFSGNGLVCTAGNTEVIAKMRNCVAINSGYAYITNYDCENCYFNYEIRKRKGSIKNSYIRRLATGDTSTYLLGDLTIENCTFGGSLVLNRGLSTISEYLAVIKNCEFVGTEGSAFPYTNIIFDNCKWVRRTSTTNSVFTSPNANIRLINCDMIGAPNNIYCENSVLTADNCKFRSRFINNNTAYTFINCIEYSTGHLCEVGEYGSCIAYNCITNATTLYGDISSEHTSIIHSAGLSVPLY